MGKTKIEWTAQHLPDGTVIPGFTMNFWVGCTKISPACDFCYAESWAKRSGHPELWAGERRRTTHSNWHQAVKWDIEAERLGVRYRVFSNSLADFFDNQVPERWRDDAWFMIDRTPNLDWMLLTKRPQNIAKMLPNPATGVKAWGEGWPNVWLGATCEDQERADQNIPHLISVPAAVKFVSVEPMLGPVIFKLVPGFNRVGLSLHNWLVICGGESGGHARPMRPDWARSLRDQCVAAGVPFFFKQWGEWLPVEPDNEDHSWYEGHSVSLPLRAWNGTAWVEASSIDTEYAARIGKKAAGRLLDGRTWDQMPGDLS